MRNPNVATFGLRGDEKVIVTGNDAIAEATTQQIANLAPGGGGGSSVTLTADTDIAAGTAASINSAGHAVQTFGPAPQIAGTAALNSGAVLVGTPIPVFGMVLDATHFVAGVQGVFLQPGSIAAGVVTLGTADTSTASVNALAWGSANEMIGGIGLSGTAFVVAYNDPISGFANIVGATISGGVISYGTPVQVEAAAIGGAPNAPIFAFLDSSHFACVFGDANNSAILVIGSLSGNTVTLGAPATITSVYSQLPYVASLSASAVVISYSDGNNSNLTTVVVASIAGVTPTLGTPVVVDSGNALNDQAYVYAFSATHFIVSAPYNSGHPLYAGSVSGTVPTLGAVYQGYEGITRTAGPQGPGAVLSATEFVTGSLTTLPSGLAGQNSIGVFSINFGTLTISLESQALLPGKLQLFSTIAACGSLFILTDTAFNIYEGDNTGILSPGITHPTMIGYWLYPLDVTHALALLLDFNNIGYARVINIEPINATPPVGLSAAAVTSGNPAVVTLTGPAAGFSGLSPGTQYYALGDGNPVTANTGHPMGVALDATHLLAV